MTKLCIHIISTFVYFRINGVLWILLDDTRE